jgi:hypothetical protein
LATGSDGMLVLGEFFFFKGSVFWRGGTDCGGVEGEERFVDMAILEQGIWWVGFGGGYIEMKWGGGKY